MNWYKKFCRLAARNPLDQDSITIAQTIWSLVKDRYLKGNLPTLSETISFKSNIKILNPPQDKQKYKKSLADENINVVNLIIEKLNIEEAFQVGGRFNENTLDISVRVSRYFGQEDFHNLYMRLLEVVRHEIKHLHKYTLGQRDVTPFFPETQMF